MAASESEISDLYVTLRAVTAPILEGFSKVGAAGEEMVAALRAQLAELDAMVTATAERMGALRGEMAAGAATPVAAGEAAGAAAGSAETVAAEREVGAAAEQAAAQVTAAEDKILAEFARMAEAAKISTAEVNASMAGMAAATKAASAGMVDAETAAAAGQSKLATAMDDGDAKAKAVAKSAGLVAAGAGIVSLALVKTAADYETATNRLVTSAGETNDKIGVVRQGLLDMSSQVGVSATQLAKDMYNVESAGYHAQAGLGVLKAAEQGAKAEGADATTVTDALSSAMRDYYPNARTAADVTKASADVMSKFIGATSAGKMTFQDLASSLHSVLPAASVAKISLEDVLASLAAMTVHGMSADQASQNLAHAIGHLQTVTAPQSKELALLGMTAQQVSGDLGSKGLTGTVQEIAGAIQKQMGPQATNVVLNLQTALSKLSPAVQDLGKKAIDGSMSWGEYSKAAKSLPVEAAGQAASFATLAKTTHAIGQEQLSSQTVMQTYSQALKAAMGDATGLNVALMLSGQNADYTNTAVKQVSGSTADAAGNVKGWSEIQGTFNQKMSEAKAGLGALAIEVGDKLLPVATKIAGALAKGAMWLSQHKVAATALAIVLGVVLAGATLTALGALLRLSAGVVTGPIKAFWSAGQAVWGFLGNLEGGLAGAESAAGTWGGRIGSILSSVGTALGNTVSALGRFASNVASGLATTLSNATSWAGSMISQFGRAAAGAVVNAAKATAAWVASMTKMIAQVVAQTAVWVGSMIARFAQVAIAAAAQALATSGAWLASMAEMAAQGLVQAGIWVAGMIVRFVAVSAAAIVSAAATVAAWVAANAALIVATGGIILVVGALVLAAYELATHWQQVWSAVRAAVSTAANWVGDRITDIVGFCLSIPDKIRGALGNLGNLLWNAGASVINGFLNGLKAAWNAVAGWVSNVAGWIASLKGPLDYDATLLVPHGHAIMGGLLNGLQAGGAKVQNYLAGFTSSIGDVAAGGLGGTITLAGGGGSPMAGGMAGGVGGSAVTVNNFNIKVDGGTFVGSNAEFVKLLQKAMVQMSGRNSGFGLSPAFA